MLLNNNQREGLARSLDNLATSCLIGAIIGATGHSSLAMFEICSLFVLAAILYGCSLFMRGLE
jgi:hypothetical protein